MSVLKSRRLWTAIVGVVLNIATFAVGHYLGDPTMQEFSYILIGGITTISGILIASYTVEDVANIKADGAVNEARAYNERALPCPEIGESGEGVPAGARRL
jgi:hypothetical protein